MITDLLRAVLVLTLLIFAGCQHAPRQLDIQAEPEIVTSLERYSRETVLMPGDQIEVAVYRNAEVSRVVVVGRDGSISIPLLDRINVAGLTLSETDKLITDLLSQRFNNPEVTVILLNAPEPLVYIVGDVGIAQPVPLRQVRTLGQAIAHMGGITRDGSRQNVALIRLDNNGYFRTMFIDGETGTTVGAYMAFQNTPLQADDFVVVPENTRSQARRFIQDFLIAPLSAVNQILGPYFQFALLDEISNP